jgi:hypothetical protein
MTNRNEIKQLMQYAKKPNNLLSMLTSIEKVSENDEKNGYHNHQTVTYLIPGKSNNTNNNNNSNEPGGLNASYIANYTSRGGQLAALNNAQNRPASRSSFKSRDVNDSYAYTDVKKYIEENELMTPEKERGIDAWVGVVNANRDYWEKNLIEMKLDAH